VAEVIQRAEAFAETESIGHDRDAGRDPRFWAAGMTWAERRAPERWGRRQETGDGPRVQITFGVDARTVTFASRATAP
jgi:hypothetical protein